MRVNPDVEEFWLDVVRGYAKTPVRRKGRHSLPSAVADGQTGDALLTRRYAGIQRRQVDKPSDDAVRDAMDAAQPGPYTTWRLTQPGRGLRAFSRLRCSALQQVAVRKCPV